MKYRDLIVGLLFFVALGIALYFAFSIGGTGTPRLPWESTEREYRIAFPTVQGLNENSAVWISGVRKGKVKTMIVDPSTGHVEVRISLDANIELKDDCEAEIIPASVFGGKAIALSMGTSATPFDENDTIEGRVVADLFTEAARGLGRINEGIEYAVETVKDVRDTIKDVRKGRGPIGTILYDENVAANIAATAENVRIGSEEAKSAVRNIRQVSEKINTGSGTANMLLEDADFSMRLHNVMVNAQLTAENVTGASRSIKSITRKLDEGSGFLPMLLNDPEVAEDFKGITRKANSTMDDLQGTLKQTNILIKGVNDGRGSVGKLFTDTTLYNDSLNAINSLRSGFEDIREQAPITTFASLLFQVFQ